jgi:hypothetical protein
MSFLSGCFLTGDGHSQTAEFFQGAIKLVMHAFALRLIHSL